VAKWRRKTTHKIYAHILFFLIGLHRKLNVTADGWLFIAWVDWPSHGKLIYCIESHFLKCGSFWEQCGGKNPALSLYSFGQEINKMMQLWFKRSLWYGFSKCVSSLFHMYLVMFTVSFIITSNWMLLSMRGRIQLFALPCESVQVLCVFLLFEKDSLHMPFSAS